MPVGVRTGYSQPTEDVQAGEIAIRALRPEDVPALWIWLNEYPRSNFDDYGPQSLEAFTAEIVARMNAGEVIAAFLHDGKFIGVCGYAQITERLGMLRGICFSKAVHGTGLAPAAVHRFLEKILAPGKVQKIQAMHFSDNLRIKKFLRKQGFTHEGRLEAHTVRGGVPTDMTLVALHRAKQTTGDDFLKTRKNRGKEEVQ